jgi:hypothetical protein
MIKSFFNFKPIHSVNTHRFLEISQTTDVFFDSHSNESTEGRKARNDTTLVSFLLMFFCNLLSHPSHDTFPIRYEKAKHKRLFRFFFSLPGLLHRHRVLTNALFMHRMFIFYFVSMVKRSKLFGSRSIKKEREQIVNDFFSPLRTNNGHHMTERPHCEHRTGWKQTLLWWLIMCSFNWNSLCHSLYHVSFRAWYFPGCFQKYKKKIEDGCLISLETKVEAAFCVFV